MVNTVMMNKLEGNIKAVVSSNMNSKIWSILAEIERTNLEKSEQILITDAELAQVIRNLECEISVAQTIGGPTLWSSEDVKVMLDNPMQGILLIAKDLTAAKK